MITAGPKHLDRGIGIAIADRIGQCSDRLTETVRGHQRGDRGVGGRRQPVDQISQHSTGLHRRQLVRIADQQQPGLGSDSLQ